jgi:hypothetical protein
MNAEHDEDENANETPHAVVWLPLEDIGLDPRPTIRRVRPVDPARVDKYVEEARPVATWSPREVRSWPASDPYPPGEEGKKWQVISGTHSTLAARRLGEAWSRLPCIIRNDIVTDADFVVAGTLTNFHGVETDPASKQRIAKFLHEDCGLDAGECAKRLRITVPTFYNWLAKRDTNASRRSGVTREAGGDGETQRFCPWSGTAGAASRRHNWMRSACWSWSAKSTR